MATLSRRAFVTSAAGVPLAALAGSIRLRAAGMPLGVTAASFRSLPRIEGRDNLQDIIRALKTVRATDVELALVNLEPAPPNTLPFMGGSAAYPQRVVLTPEQVMATNKYARASLREWRLNTDAASFAGQRRALSDAGIAIHACAATFDDSCTDEELDAMFRQVKALGVRTVTAAPSVAMAKRLLPVADRHQIDVAIRNQGSMADSQAVLALSPMFRVAFDVGNVTAANGDAVAELRGHQPRIAYVIVKDRLRNGGASQVFGEGDTPIRDVMKVLRAASPAIPALVEYDYVGLRPVTDEVSACLRYAGA